MIRRGQSCKCTRFSRMDSLSSSLSVRLISSKCRKAHKQQLKIDYAATRAHKHIRGRISQHLSAGTGAYAQSTISENKNKAKSTNTR